MSNPPSERTAARRLRRLGALIRAHARGRFESGRADETQEVPPAGPGGRHRWVIDYLRGIPFVLGAVFAGSLLWDFPGWTWTLAGWTLELEGILRAVSVAGLIGFGTNWLAIHMLFRPRRPRPILGQGLLPAQRDMITRRMARTISEELLDEALIEEQLLGRGLTGRYRAQTVRLLEDLLADDRVRVEIRALASEGIETLLDDPSVREPLVRSTLRAVEEQSRDGLPGLALRAYRYFNEEGLEEHVRTGVARLADHADGLVAEIDRRLDRLPTWLNRRSDRIDRAVSDLVIHVIRHLDLETIVLENLRRLDERELERVLTTTSNEQLNYIKYLGGLLGCVGGLLIWQPILALLLLTGLAGSILLIDELILRSADSP